MSKKAVKTFSCIKCGFPYQAYSPDDKHRIASMIEREAGKDHITVNYICKNCGNTNVLYWIHPPLDPAFHG